MATDIPILWKIALVSACLSLANVVFFPQVFPDTQVTKVFFIFTGINFVLWLLFKINIYPYWFSPFRHLPKPQGGYPIIGHSYIIAQRPSGSSFLKFITEVPNDGIIKFRGPIGADWLLLSDPRSLGDVLVHNAYDFTKPTEIRNFLRLILGDGLIITEGDEHKFQRKHISPAFSFRHIKELYPIFWSKAIELSRGIDGEISENPEKSLVDEKMVNPSSVIEINHWANKVTMDIIGVAGLGRDFNTLKNSDDELIKNYEEILEPTTEKGIFFTTHLIFSRQIVKLLPWRLNKLLEITTGNLRNICLQLVREKKELIKTHQDENIDILSLMIKSNNFSDDALVDQLLTFLAAGHETTSSAFTWATYLLSKHPEMQQRLRQEIRATVPSPSAALEPTTDLDSILESLPYLNAVCNEVLRLYPPVPVTLRVSVRPTTIQGQPIPKGTRIYISPWAINRSPHLWGSNAADFQPDRWIDADTGKANNTGGVTSNYSILTFLHGPRSCIGERFAKNEFKALMAVFCGTFEMELADPAHVPMPAGAITTKPQGGMRLRLRKVDGW